MPQPHLPSCCCSTLVLIKRIMLGHLFLVLSPCLVGHVYVSLFVILNSKFSMIECDENGEFYASRFVC